jgi:hypothetical protein
MRLPRPIRAIRLLWLFLKSAGLLLFLGVRLKLKEVRERLKNETKVSKAEKTSPRPGNRITAADPEDQESPEVQKQTPGKPPFRPKGTLGQDQEQSGPGGTISPAGERPLEVDEKLAGELIAIPFDIINVFEPAWEPMTEAEQMRAGEPFNIWLQEQGLTSLKRPDLMTVLRMAGYITRNFRNVRVAVAKRKKEAQKKPEEKIDPDNSRMSRGGEDVPRMVDREKV